MFVMLEHTLHVFEPQGYWEGFRRSRSESTDRLADIFY
jgi:hypothetical protein